MRTMPLGSLAGWKGYLDLAYSVKPPEWDSEWDSERARIDVKVSEPGRMNASQAMCKSAPTDAGAELAHVRCSVLVVEGGADPDWAEPRAEGGQIVADLPDGLGKLSSSRASVIMRTPRCLSRSSHSRYPFLAKTLARA